jgi:hypothetical protein
MQWALEKISEKRRWWQFPYFTPREVTTMPVKTSADTDTRLVSEIEALLERASVGTRAAVAAACLPGRIRAFSPHYAALGHEEQSRLAASTKVMMATRGELISMTGITAAIAINWCEAEGRDYRIERHGEKYVVEVLL